MLEILLRERQLLGGRYSLACHNITYMRTSSIRYEVYPVLGKKRPWRTRLSIVSEERVWPYRLTSYALA